MLQSGVFDVRPESEPVFLAVARVLIIKRDVPSLNQSNGLLERLLVLTEPEGRMGILIEALALKALLEWTLGNQPDAMTALEKSLRFTEREGYVRVFVDMGLPSLACFKKPVRVLRCLIMFTGCWLLTIRIPRCLQKVR